MLAPINARTIRPESTEGLAAFVKDIYLPYCKGEVRPSTYKSYEDMHALVEPHFNGLQLRDVRTSDIDRILKAVADRNEVNWERMLFPGRLILRPAADHSWRWA